jgi:hypothetical protein
LGGWIVSMLIRKVRRMEAGDSRRATGTLGQGHGHDTDTGTAMADLVCDQSMAGIAAMMPGASSHEVALRWSELHYGTELTERVRQWLAVRA